MAREPKYTIGPHPKALLRHIMVVAYRYYSAKEVAGLFCVNPQTVIDTVRRAGEPIRPRGVAMKWAKHNAACDARAAAREANHDVHIAP